MIGYINTAHFKTGVFNKNCTTYSKSGVQQLRAFFGRLCVPDHHARGAAPAQDRPHVRLISQSRAWHEVASSTKDTDLQSSAPARAVCMSLRKISGQARDRSTHARDSHCDQKKAEQRPSRRLRGTPSVFLLSAVPSVVRNSMCASARPSMRSSERRARCSAESEENAWSRSASRPRRTIQTRSALCLSLRR